MAMSADKRPQHGDGQTTWDGMERRRETQAAYKGEERRRVNPVARAPGGNPQGGNPGGRGEDPTQ
jgi:hypothetical protein